MLGGTILKEEHDQLKYRSNMIKEKLENDGYSLEIIFELEELEIDTYDLERRLDEEIKRLWTE